MGSPNFDCDVCILGGGPSGLSASLALVHRGARVTLIEKSDYTMPRWGEHIPASSISTLLEIGFSPTEIFDSRLHLKSSGIRSYWSASENKIDYFLHPYGFGLNLSRPEFDSSLARVANAKGVRIILNGQFITSSQDAEKWILKVKTGNGPITLEARYMIDATGRRAVFAKRMGGTIKRVDSQIAVNRRFEVSKKSRNLSLNEIVIESCEIGWWYLCPLSTGSFICTLFTDSDLFARGRVNHEYLWNKYFAKAHHIFDYLAPFKPGNLTYCPASTQCLSKFLGGGWVAVGDSAFTFDPLSGQGITKGLRQGWTVGEAVAEYLNGKKDSLVQAIDDMENIFRNYLKLRPLYYGLEQRWINSEFWSRRSSAPL
ncbi:MAG: NAD(P)/FAD-dependent oxidoreductase [Nitrospirales bacterium]|nr:NAD(P)/FAD-dependent oxidoreductase [Nitrospirales bacterium]